MQQIFNWYKPKSYELYDDKQITIYIDLSQTTNIKIEFKPNMLIEDILKVVDEEQQQQVTIILINSNVQRRLWGYEKVEDVLNNQCNKLVLYNCKKKLQHSTQKYSKYFDDNFRAYGKLMKKNKFGIYISTMVYLSSSYFGFRNEKKEKIKLSSLENIKLFLWKNNTQFDFQIENERKLYFFQAIKESDFHYWISSINSALEQTYYKVLFTDLDKKIASYTRMQVNAIEELAQNSLQQVILHKDYLQQLQFQITDICDVNIIQFILSKNEDLIPHIRKQIQTDTFSLLTTIQSNQSIEPLEIFTTRYHQLFENEEQQILIDKLQDEIYNAYSGYLKIKKITNSIIIQPKLQFKEQLYQFKPNFDQFYQ